ncbi:MAG: hypothetical protein GY899_08975 [Verrucomicrobiaceae bacterium]|nr:hypothetical protein [Verrucomicrobiaceae bacterium]
MEINVAAWVVGGVGLLVLFGPMAYRAIRMAMPAKKPKKLTLDQLVNEFLDRHADAIRLHVATRIDRELNDYLKGLEDGEEHNRHQR